MSVQLSGSVIAAIYAQGDTPDTPIEWVIAAINLGGVAATGDIKADGSVPFTGQETFGAGLKSGLIEDNGAGITLNSISANADGFRISIHNDGAIGIGDTDLNSGGLTLRVDDSNGWIKIDNVAHDVGFYINNVQGGSGTIDTAITPNLVFNNGVFISAS